MYPLLQIKDLSVDFKTESGTIRAIQNISLDIGFGETVAVVGESGSGKTVTSLSVLQLLPVPPAIYRGGEILFSKTGDRQVDLLGLSGESLRKIRGNEISMIFQEPMSSLNPVHTCGSQAMEALHQRLTIAAAKARTLELFRGIGLPPDTFNRYPHQLSGGQKQRVMIAMAMSCHPKLLIADEPTTALDVKVQKTILHLLKGLQQRYGLSILYITHDLGVVAEIADRVLVMYKGAVVETADVGKVFSQPEHPYTRALLACRPALYKKHQRLPVVGDVINGTKDVAGSDAAAGAGNPAQKQRETILAVRDLKVYFVSERNFFGRTAGQFKAVDDVSFEIKRGESIGLAGESGCGKTTLGRTLIRLIRPTAGNIFFEGRDIARLSKAEMRHMRKRIQIIFQDPFGSLNPRITVGDAIQEPLKWHGLKNAALRRERVMELLQQVQLKPEHFNRYPHEFSGGQRQRICIARALGLRPAFLICDESVSSLDVSVQAQILNLLNDLKKNLGFTLIFISHDLEIVRYLSDRILVMNKGRIVESGPADEVYLNPQHAYTKELLSAIPKRQV